MYSVFCRTCCKHAYRKAILKSPFHCETKRHGHRRDAKELQVITGKHTEEQFRDQLHCKTKRHGHARDTNELQIVAKRTNSNYFHTPSSLRLDRSSKTRNPAPTFILHPWNIVFRSGGRKLINGPIHKRHTSSSRLRAVALTGLLP